MSIRKLFCETCDGSTKPTCRAAGHNLKRRYAANKGLRKRCKCSRRTWETSSHPWHFNFMLAGIGYRECLETSDYDEAKRRFANAEAAIRNGTYTKPKGEPAPAVDRPTFAVVAGQYAKRHIKARLVAGARSNHGYHSSFLAGVTVSPGMPFTDKPLI